MSASLPVGQSAGIGELDCARLATGYRRYAIRGTGFGTAAFSGPVVLREETQFAASIVVTQAKAEA